MTTQGIKECCVSGHLHDGKPKGAVTEIAGLKTYVTFPENGNKNKAILFITDIFGYQLPVTLQNATLIDARMRKFWRMNTPTADSTFISLTSSMVSHLPAFDTF